MKVESFLKKELIKYIRQEIEKGHNISKIKASLLRAGHHKDMIGEAILSLKRHNFDVVKALETPIKGPDKEIYMDVMNSLIRYIEHQLEQGSTIHEIEETLLKFGHSKEIILEALDSALRKKPETRMNVPVVILITATLIIAFFVLSSAIKVAVTKIILGLLPTILTLIAAVALVERIKVKEVLWTFPFLSLIIFFLVATTETFYVFRNLDIKNLAIANLVISLFYVFLILMTTTEKEK